MAGRHFFGIPLTLGRELEGAYAGFSVYSRDQRYFADLHRFFELLRPRPCPVPLIRVGGSGDGAYLIPDDLAGIEACFSPGVNNFKNFEDDLSGKHGIACHMCDLTSDVERLATPLDPRLQTFEKKWLAAESARDCITMSDWSARKCRSPESDLILQMDIEGAEYKILLAWDREMLARFRILVIEFHGLHRALADPLVLRQVCLPLFEALSRDFVCVHAHPNNYYPFGHVIPRLNASLPELLELTFLRRDRFAVGDSCHHFPLLIPHPLDIFNVPGNPPFFLEREWCGGRRPWRSKLKILCDRLLYRFRRS